MKAADTQSTLAFFFSIKVLFQEADEEEQKTLRIQAKLDAKKRKMAELALMKSRKRPDPNNPSKEELVAAQARHSLNVYKANTVFCCGGVPNM